MCSCFLPTDILLPRKTALDKWAVIACDQFTSEMDYWNCVDEIVKDSCSARHIIVPEAMLSQQNSGMIRTVALRMREYLNRGVFQEYRDSFVYVERTLANGDVRRGIVGMLDLADYAFDGSRKRILATEHTVPERLPARIEGRVGAPLEISHTMLLCDDAQDLIIGCASRMRDTLPLLYDFELMLGGGHISGWLLQGAACQQLQQRIWQYCDNREYPLFAVGDGNHSVAAAKACYQMDTQNALARFTLAELVNIRDPGVVFFPIHRIVTQCDTKQLLDDLQLAFGAADGPLISYCSSDGNGQICLGTENPLPVAALQDFLDEWISAHKGEIDYIHGEDAVKKLSQADGTVGFLLPPLDKNMLFAYIAHGKRLPRKAFSMGHAREKRYYLEGRKIK